MGEHRKTLTMKAPVAGGAAPGPSEPTRAGGPKACLVVSTGPNRGRRVDLEGTTKLGAGDMIEVAASPSAMPVAELTVEDGVVVLRSLSEPPQTVVNDRPVHRVVLRHGDCVRLGAQELTVLVADDLEAAYREELYRQVTRDGETAAYHARYFMENLRSLSSRARRWNAALSVVAIRLGGWGLLRRRRGEDAAAAAMERLTREVIALVRADDIVARLAEDELGVILFRTPRVNAEQFAERVRRVGAPPDLELLLGVATMDRETTDGEILLRDARAQVNPWPTEHEE
jgi:diguanylate cyclase (GGDEF)-like protein